MIAIDPASVIREQLTSGLDIQSTGNDAAVVYMPFLFSNGDVVCVYLQRTKDGEWQLSDDGEVMSRAVEAGFDFSNEVQEQQFRTLVDFYGAREKDGVIDMRSSSNGLADAIFTFTQTCLEATWIARRPKTERREARRIRFSQKLSKLVTECFPTEAVETKWHDPNTDPKGLYTADYRIQTHERQLLLFGVASELSCMQAAMSCLHFKNAGLQFRSLAVYDDEGKITKRHAEQLNEVVDKRFPRIVERRSIREHMLQLAI